MKKRILVTLFFILTVSCAFIAHAATKGFEAEVVKVYKTGAQASWLAGSHEKQGVSCNDCHGEKGEIDDNEAVVNASCVNCHGDLEKMGELKKGEIINSHESHFGVMSCTTCHSGHVTSYSYCNNCHDFKGTIPFNGAKKVYGMENFEAYDNVAPMHTETTDIVIIGSGGTGSTAALKATEAGAKVILLEKMPLTGGNTMIGAGSMNASQTKFQAAKGIKDDNKIYFEDTMKGGRNINDPKLVDVLVKESSNSIDWLATQGARLDYFIGIGGGASVIRGHSPDGGKPVGAFILKHLKKQLADKNVDVRVNSRVVKLLTDKNGNVTGVLVKGKHSGLYQINAKAVVLASGGFGANKDMVYKYREDTLSMSTSNQPGATGDGLVLAGRIGAAFRDLKEVQAHPSVAVGSQILISEKTRGVGAILINLDGNRFFNELMTRDKVSNAILAQRNKQAYLVFDDAMRDNMSMLKGYTALGLVKEAATPKELAKLLGLPEEAFAKSIAEYNEAFDKKKDEKFGRTNMKGAIRTGNICAILISPGVHYTMGGLQINTDAQVLREDGKPIGNLFAGGEVTGGVHGGNRLGGNSISETITFGRIAGDNAAKTAKAKK